MACAKMPKIIYIESHNYKLCSVSQLTLRIWAQKLCEKGTFGFERGSLGFEGVLLHSLLKSEGHCYSYYY